MKQSNFFEEQVLKNDDYRFIEESTREAIRQRFKTYWNLPGVVFGLEVLPGASPDSIIITSGLAYNLDGEEIIVTEPITEFITNFVTLPPSLSTSYFVKLDFDFVLTTPRYNPDTGLGPTQTKEEPYLTRKENGYKLTIDNVPPQAGDKGVVLAVITNHLVGNPIQTTSIDEDAYRTIASVKKSLVEVLNHSELDNSGTLTHSELETTLTDLSQTIAAIQNSINNVILGEFNSLYTSLQTTGLGGNIENSLAFYMNEADILTWNSGFLYNTIIAPSGIPITGGTATVTAFNYIVVNTTTGIITLTGNISSLASNELILGNVAPGRRLVYWYGDKGIVTLRNSNADDLANRDYSTFTFNSIASQKGTNPSTLFLNNLTTGTFSSSNIISLGGTNGSTLHLGSTYPGLSNSFRPRFVTRREVNAPIIMTLSGMSSADEFVPSDSEYIAPSVYPTYETVINIGKNTTASSKDGRINLTAKLITMRGKNISRENTLNLGRSGLVNELSDDQFIYNELLHDSLSVDSVALGQPLYTITRSNSSSLSVSSTQLKLHSMLLNFNHVSPYVFDLTAQSLTTTAGLFLTWDYDAVPIVESISNATLEVLNSTDHNKVFTNNGRVRYWLLKYDGELLHINYRGQYKALKIPAYVAFNNTYDIQVFYNKLVVTNISGPGAGTPTTIRDAILDC